MAAIEDIIAWCQQEQSRLAHQLEQLESGWLRTVEKHAQAPGWLEIDTTAQSIDLCRQYISELGAIVARRPEVAPLAAGLPLAAPPRVVPPEPPPAEARAERKPLTADATHPGWVNGWAVVKGQPPNWEVADIYATHADALAAATKAGGGYYARWGGYNAETKEFTSGPQFGE